MYLTKGKGSIDEILCPGPRISASTAPCRLLEQPLASGQSHACFRFIDVLELDNCWIKEDSCLITIPKAAELC